MNPGLCGCGLCGHNSRGPKPRIITMLDYDPYAMMWMGLYVLVECERLAIAGYLTPFFDLSKLF